MVSPGLTSARPAFDTWFDEALRERDSGRRQPFAVRLTDGTLVGSSSYLDD